MTLYAHGCPDGHLTIPGHYRCPVCGADQTERIDLTAETGTVVTWTRNTATPPGVEAPNDLAIVEFTIDGTSIRTIGQTTEPVQTGDTVEPVHTNDLRDPTAGIRHPDSQDWDGYRFRPVD